MKKTLLSILMGMGIAFLVIQFVQPAIVNGQSMYPNLEDGDFLIMKKINVDPDYGDIIIFKNENIFLIKRVIGKPGDTIEFRDDKIYLNGKILHERYINCHTPSGENVTLGNDEYYAMGDNRGNSLDSRVFGPVHKKDIKGIAFIRLFSKLDLL